MNVDISPLEPYIEPIREFHQEILEKDVREFGRDVVFARQMLNLDCSRIIKGYRVQQTISYTYICEMTRTLYVIQTWFEDKADDKLREVLEQHNKNLEFEKLNPPIMYGGKKAAKKLEKYMDGVKPARRRNKQTRINFDENGEPIKSAAERKLAAKAARLNALKFNFKPINNGGNTV